MDISAAILIGLFLDKRWTCRNLCFMGTLCSFGAKYSRLIPVVDTNKCTLCGKCQKECLINIPLTDYIKNNSGLIENSECLLCGKCVNICNVNAIKIGFVWNRKKYKTQIKAN